MKVNIFFSWQSDTHVEFNKNFVGDALKEAIKLLKRENKGIEFSDLQIDRDTRNIPGSPNIPLTLDNKIRECQIFVGDLTVTSPNNLISWLFPPKKLSFNSNVLLELGKAEAILGSKGIICVFNETYYKLKDGVLPFDIAQNSWPICYTYSKKERVNKNEILKKLARGLADKIKLIIKDGILNPQLPNYPFLEWEQWTREFAESLEIDFESNETLNSIIEAIRKESLKERSIVRFIGLSGLGKTRLVYEAFNPDRDARILPRTQGLFYLDLNTSPDFREKLLKLSESGEKKILIFDNCSRQALLTIAPLIKKTSSKLSVIAIDYNVPISLLEQDSDAININLKQGDLETVIDDLLLKFFPDSADEQERAVIKQFAKGHTLIATLLAQDKKRNSGSWKPIITKAEVLRKILGDFGNGTEQRKVLRAVSIFEKLGHYDELSFQTEFVATNDLLTDLTAGNKFEAFKEVCGHYLKKGIMEQQARYLFIRAKPIALSLAVEWWEACDSVKAMKVFEAMNDQQELKESLTDQLRYLDFVENAQNVVENLVRPTGPFGTAEVLNTEEGSRLFRSFVEVNPLATADALSKIFSNKTKEELFKVDRGRRNLVWALEKLCFRADTFEQAVKVLLSFAVAENEAMIVNNATGQFLQLFQAFLPGTQADYQARIEIIDYTLSTGGEFARLGVSALQRGLKSRDFHRGGGAEDQGSGAPLKDYPQTDEQAKKVQDYWQYCINRLLQFAIDENEFANSARGSLIKSIRSFCSVGVANLILPAIEQLLQSSMEDWYEIKSNLKTTLKYEKYILKQTERETIVNLLKNLDLKDFVSQYIEKVASPRWDDEVTGFDVMERNAKMLALDFVINNEYNSASLRLFFTGEQQNGRWFGEGIADNLDDSKSKDFFLASVDVLKSISTDKYELSVLIGFIRGTKSEARKTEYLRQLFADPHFNQHSFYIAGLAAPPSPVFDDLIELVKERGFSVFEFGRFQYGRALDHLTHSDVLQICSKVASINLDGVKTVLSLLYMYCYNNDENWQQAKSQIRELLGEKGILVSRSEGGLDRYKWGDLCEKFLSDNDEELALHLTLEIVDLCRTGFVSPIDSELKAILRILLTRYFDTSWPTLSVALLSESDDYIVYFSIKGLLTSHINSYGPDKGVLFLGDLEKIFEWCNQNQPTAPNRLANMAPIFHETEAGQWHPFTLRLIDTFGDNDDFIDNLSANMNTYSWTGSIVPLLEDKKALLSALKGHSISRIRVWASQTSDYLDELIRKENHEDIERYL
jgi:hypothetical protein